MQPQSCKRKIAAVAAVIVVTVISLLMPMTNANAATGVIELSGSAWYGAHGVAVCDNSQGGSTCEGAAPVGSAWQCVELAQRFYQAQGWHAGVFSNVNPATDIYNNYSSLGFSATRQPDGGISSVVPGDMVVFSGGSTGHVALVDVVVDNGNGTDTVNLVSQNNYSGARSTSTWNLSAGTLTSPYLTTGNTTMPTMGVVHAVANTKSVVVGISSTVTSGGVFHVFSSTSTGGLYDTYWGGGTSLTTWTLATGLGSITSITSTVTPNGVYHVFSGTSAGTLRDTYWGGGTTLATWTVAAL